MSRVFQNIDPPTLSARRVCTVYPPASPLLRGEDTLAGRRGGWGVNILEDVRHSSVLYLYRILFAYMVMMSHPIFLSSVQCVRRIRI
jgi:hypothetical protein